MMSGGSRRSTACYTQLFVNVSFAPSAPLAIAHMSVILNRFASFKSSIENNSLRKCFELSCPVTSDSTFYESVRGKYPVP
jgi:hypothetical protein